MPMKSTTPLEITELELEFMKSINPNIKDITSKGKYFFYLPTTKEMRYHNLDECQRNVSIEVSKNGGKPLIGWIIWKSQVFIEALYHHVWLTPKGKIKDVTPRFDKEKLILFVVDPTQQDDGLIKDSKRKIILDIPPVRELDKILAERVKIQRQYWVPYKNAMNAPLEIYHKINELEQKRGSIINDINNFLDSPPQ